MKDEALLAEPDTINKILLLLNQYTNKRADKILRFCVEYIEDRL